MNNILFSSSINYESNLLQILSLASIIFGIYTIISKNPIMSVLFLIGLFVSISLYLIVSGLQFIGFSYLIIYIGAISILFIFILMLINIRVSELSTESNNSIPLAVLIILFFNISLSNIVSYDFIKLANINVYNTSNDIQDYIINVTSNGWETTLANITHVSSIGNILYSIYFILFFILSLILLLAMIGSIIITINSSPNNLLLNKLLVYR